jgi:glycerol kinase
VNSRYILAIDQGTTGSTALLIDVSNPTAPSVCGRGTVDFVQHFPDDGWVEHDLDEIWQSVRQACRLAMEEGSKSGFKPRCLETIGITNQRETLCAFDRKSGNPLMRAIVWQCKRSTEICEQLRLDGCEQEVRSKTGLVLDPYFTGSKIAWTMQNRPVIAKLVHSGQAVLGTIDSYLLHRLTGGVTFATDASNASRTMLVELEKGDYDSSLMEMLGVPSESCLPEIRDSAGDFGHTKGLDFLPDGVPINGVLGDQQAAMAGQSCFKIGEAKCTYGTGAFLLVNMGSTVTHSNNGLLTTILWSLKGRSTYAFEGSSFIAGAAIQFLRDQLTLLSSAKESMEMAHAVEAAPHLIFVPALAGLGAPYWNPDARGAFLGMTRGTSKAQIIRAALEGISFQVNDLIGVMVADLKENLKVLRVDGGAASNNMLMQMQANYSGVTVDRPRHLETTAFGAAMFAGLGRGLYQSLDELHAARVADTCFEPAKDIEGQKLIEEHMRAWNRAIQAVEVFSKHEL